MMPSLWRVHTPYIILNNPNVEGMDIMRRNTGKYGQTHLRRRYPTSAICSLQKIAFHQS